MALAEKRGIMYCDINFKTKKALKEAVATGRRITIYSPGVGDPKANGTESVEGPWSPRPHTWYARVEMKDGIIIKVS